MSTFYVDYEGGNDANNGTSFALRKKTLGSANTAASAGDTVRVMAAKDPTSIGNATWNNLSKTVTLAGALTANISLCEAAWTASVNVTTATSATNKQGTFSTSIAIGAVFVTGVAAFEAFAATDFSAYKQVSFWIRTNAAIAASTLELRLCSDALAITTVNTIAVPAIPNLNAWTSITVDTGATLGASIQSIALAATSDPGTVTILLDNIVACKDSTSADSITLNSLIGKNTGTEQWYAIQSINGTTVLLDAVPNSLASAGRGYYGVTETVTTYKREPIQTDLSATNPTFSMTKGGSIGSPITFSGGWDRTDMSTQTGITWFTGRNAAIEAIRTESLHWLTFDKISATRYLNGYQFFGSNNVIINNSEAHNCGQFGFNVTSANFCTLNSCYANNSTSGGVNNSSGNGCNFSGIVTSNNLSNGINLGTAQNGSWLNVECYNNASGVYNNFSGNNFFTNLTTISNTSEGLRNDTGTIFIKNANLNEAIPVNVTSVNFPKNFVKITKFNGNANDNRIYVDAGLVQSVADSDRHTASGLAWKLSPTSTNANILYPVICDGIKIACAANSQVTVSIWVKRSNLTITAKMVVKGGQIAGVPNDVTATASGSAGTYEQISLSFTPTEAGVVDVELQAYGGTTFNAVFDDMTITQL